MHEISRTPSTVRSSSLDDSYGERQLRKGPVLQSRFSVDFDSSSEDEDSGSDDSNPDNHKDYVYIMSQKSFSRNPSGTNNPSTSSSRYHTRKNSVRDSHIRDSIMTVKESLNSSRASEPDPGHGVHSPPRTEQTNESRKHSRVPPLTLSIPHQFGSIHASHSLVLQDLKETLRREYGSQISPSNNNDYAVTAKPVQPIVSFIYNWIVSQRSTISRTGLGPVLLDHITIGIVKKMTKFLSERNCQCQQPCLRQVWGHPPIVHLSNLR